MVKRIRKKALDSRRILVRFLTLPLVLGSLLLVSGLAGIYVTQRSADSLQHLNDVELDPILNMDEIVMDLNELDRSLLTVRQIGLTAESEKKNVEAIQKTIKRIKKATQEELNKK